MSPERVPTRTYSVMREGWEEECKEGEETGGRECEEGSKLND